MLCGLDLTARGSHRCGMLRGDVTLILRRAFARAVAGRLGLLGGVEEFDVLRLGQTRQTAGAAIDAGGFHCIHKLPVCAGIACDDGGPARIVFGGDSCRLACHGFLSVDLFDSD
ncbi:hypothetical protein D3C84_1074230 [compost metagenome]